MTWNPPQTDTIVGSDDGARSSYNGSRVPSPAVTYADRKEQGLCVSRGCRRSASDESALCAIHHRKRKRANKEWRQRQRDERRERGLCVWCPQRRAGGPARSVAGSTACLTCQIARRRLPKTVEGVGAVVDSSPDRAARIAAMTRKDAGNRTRYHGQGKRGMQPKLQLDGQDLGFAREELDAGLAALKILDTDAVKAMPRIQREGVTSAALHQLQRAIGHIEDVLERRGHFKVRHGRRDGE